MKCILLLLQLLVVYSGCAQNRVWLIGTAHEETKYVTPDSLLHALNKLKPDVILLELEAQHFTKDFTFNTATYPLKDYLTTNENIASYTYQQQHGTQLRPFDIEGRHAFYERERYREREQQLFAQIMKLYKSNQLSTAGKTDFELLLLALGSYSNLSVRSLKELNSNVTTRYTALKSTVDFELMLSIVRQTNELAPWLPFAELRKAYWQKRNTAMCDNIVRYAREFTGKKLVVLVGNEHKYILQDMLKQRNMEVKEY
ncbi:hypothetical protein [Hymenobacter fodinae]|uniref:TraB family protein n=1 Tax=Hymenobacter fodinae TaxID=2510796 RepID=A0A4Z0NYV4_9BACT|nr:hypothetical protein [Hymenobacter fodinae]TGE03722.1 hypothetical protein EU556_24215 [Hymenobacter fodinae]